MGALIRAVPSVSDELRITTDNVNWFTIESCEGNKSPEDSPVYTSAKLPMSL
jgi:hypothetical protein